MYKTLHKLVNYVYIPIYILIKNVILISLLK
jgi:hypothetical protein